MKIKENPIVITNPDPDEPEPEPTDFPLLVDRTCTTKSKKIPFIITNPALQKK